MRRNQLNSKVIEGKTMFTRKHLILVAGLVCAGMAPTSATQYPFPTGMQVTIEKGSAPVYSQKYNVVYPVENHFSGTFPGGTAPAFTLQHEDGTGIDYQASGEEFKVDHTLTPFDRVYFAEDTATATRPVRVMIQGPINIGYINFTSGSSTLTFEAKKAMDEVAMQMMSSGLTSAYLVGSTDRAGSDSANLALSRKRVDKAAEYLKARLTDIGVPDAVITTENMGEYLSTAKNGSKNPLDRKVTFLIFPTVK